MKTHSKPTHKLLLGISNSESYGFHPAAWRLPSAPDNAFTDIDVIIKKAQMAEQGGLDYIFYGDRVFLHEDLNERSPLFASIEPMVLLSAITPATKRIGLVTSASTSFNEPYTLARQLRALDVISGGRVGWNAIPSYEPQAFANYGKPVPSSDKKYERLHESVQITQALWGSWQKEAGEPDKASGRFADMRYIQPINLQGKQVGSYGPLQIPPSKQGQPVIFMPFASGKGIEAAALYANAMVAMPSNIAEGKQQIAIMNDMAKQVGREVNEIKLLAFLNLSLGDTEEDAVAHRMTLDSQMGMDWIMRHLAVVLGINLDPSQIDTPLTETQIASLRPRLRTPQSHKVIELAKQGKTPRQILAYGLYEPMLNLIGSPNQAVDMMQEWLEQGACQGFTLILNDHQHDLPILIEQVIPMLRERGLRADDYLGETLRDHLGVDEQLGLDSRMVGK